MKGKMLRNLLIFMLAALFVGCATPQFKPTAFTPYQFEPDQYVAKVDTALILFDASSSMTQEYYKRQAKINIAKDVVYHMNQTIPEIKMNAGMRVFGQNPSVGPGNTVLVYGITDYSRAGLNSGIDAIQGDGLTTPMAAAMQAAGTDLETATGPMALILVSDGKNPVIPGLSYLDKDVETLKETYGDRLCIYTIGIGADPQGIGRLKTIADMGGCGFYTNADELATSGAMAAFVEKVLLAKRPMAPPPPPAPKAVAPPLKCPNAPREVEVDADGCWIAGMVHFDFDKSNIKPQYQAFLDDIASLLMDNPTVQMEISGDTDNIGTAEYNQVLSERRAESVKQYLIQKGIDADRLSTVGYGFRQPIATNNTEDGRAQNRRAELKQVP